jgi:hypothetical protein
LDQRKQGIDDDVRWKQDNHQIQSSEKTLVNNPNDQAQLAIGKFDG